MSQFPLPKRADLLRISRSVSHFPASSEVFAKAAADLGYGADIIAFIRLFSDGAHEEFQNSTDFYSRAVELEMLIREERINPKEELCNPQS